MDVEQRIEQFRTMAEADPANELGHFSLGKACFEAARYDEAAASLQRTLELNPGHSRAYHLLAQAQNARGDRDGAVATLERGYQVAHERGDMMPRNEMGELLTELGGTMPVVAEPETAAAPAAGETAAGFRCSRCNGTGPALPERPFKGELGERILVSVCANCWREWIGMGTKVINEMRLQLNVDAHQEIYDQHMKEFLNL